MTSIKDVAKKAGVSIATVSRYVNKPSLLKDSTSEKVRDAIAETGYAPNALAQSFRKGKTQRIAVIVPSSGLPFYEDVLHGLWHVAVERHYQIVVRESNFTDLEFKDLHRMITAKEVDGVVLLSPLSNLEQDLQLQTEQRNSLPIVFGFENSYSKLEALSSVCIDNYEAAQDATRYLINLGHKDIAFIYGAPGDDETLCASRKEGFQDAMSKANLPPQSDWIVDGKSTMPGARAAVREMFEKNKLPTAIFCTNDEMAMGVIHEIKVAGKRVPNDISVIGFENIRFSEICDPPLTTIGQPAELIGTRAMEKLFQILDGDEKTNNSETVDHTLVVRRSTAPPKN